MEFKKEKRSCQTPSGFRLATVEEATQNLQRIKPLLNKWDAVRLLDGWVSASPDGEIERPEVGFRHGLGYMLITPTPQISAGESSPGAETYGDQVSVTEEGKQAALLLCADDFNYEVQAFSEAVSRVAIEFNGSVSKTEERKQITRDSVAKMVRHLLESESMRNLFKTARSEDAIDEGGY
eukprot:Gb_18515 [translate_table: standard]